MPLSKQPLRFLFAASLVLGGTACGSDDGEAGTHGDGHSDTDGSDPDAMVMWVDGNPPATVMAGEPLAASFMVHTTGDIHVTELRACSGADVADCGLGDMDSFESAPAPAVEGQEDTYAGELTLAAGDWTVVAFAHIGADPHVSMHANVTVQ